MGVSGRVNIGLASFRITPVTSPDLSRPYTQFTIPFAGDAGFGFTYGDGAGQIDVLYAVRKEATTGGVSFNLQNLSDLFSTATYSLATLKLAYFKNRSTDTVAYVLADGDVFPWGEQSNERIYMRPLTPWCILAMDATGYAISAANNSITIKTASGSAYFDVVLGGVKT